MDAVTRHPASSNVEPNNYGGPARVSGNRYMTQIGMLRRKLIPRLSRGLPVAGDLSRDFGD